jgi:succinoglycan biosynthesis transport protein ExoP
MTASQFLSILRARWWLALLVLLLTVGAALGVSLILPKQYNASASLMVDLKPDPVSAMIYGGMASPAFMATQVDIIKSDRVAQRVVRNLKLTDNPQVRQQWQDETKGVGSIEAWLGNTFQRSMEVIPSRESSVISISYKAPDPRFAAGLANAFAQAYIDTSLELRVDPARQYSGFFETRSKEARENLERAQAKVSAFQSENGLIANDERLDVETMRLNELSSQYTTLQAMAAESGSREAAAASGQGDRMQEVLNNGLLAQLKADVSRNEARLKEVSTRLGDAHPQVEELRASLVEQRNRLEQETRRVTSGVGITNNITRQRMSEVKASLEAQRAKLLRMKAVRDQAAVLLRDVDNAQRAYDAVQQRFTQSNLEGQTTQSSANLLSQATVPTEPSSPNILRNVLLGLLGGTALGVMLVFGLELRDRRVRSVDDVVATLELPVLGVMPKPGIGTALGRKRLTTLQQRLLAPLPHSPKGA